MPEYLLFPWISLSLVVLLAASVLAWRAASASQARRRACAGLAVSTACLTAARLDMTRGGPGDLFLEPWSGLLPEGWFGLNALNADPLPLFAALALGFVGFAPKYKVNPRWAAGFLLLAAGTLAVYAAESLLVLILAWAATGLPFFTQRFFGEQEIPRLARGALLGSLICSVAGVGLLVATSPISWNQSLSLPLPRAGSGTWQVFAFILLTAAVFARKGLLPAHPWIVTAFERGPLLPLTLFLNGHLGVFLMARLAIPALPDVALEFLPAIGVLGLLTAAYAALLGMVESKPRRLLALLSISQAAFLLVGLGSGNAEGIAGALLHLQVAAVSSSVIVAVYAGLEARLGPDLDNRHYLGLASGAPRLAVFFLMGGLSLVGLPPMLGFCAEDLLMHGTLAEHPLLGVLMPVVIALNAFTLMRLFARLFLGPPGEAARGITDALPRERWALTAALLFLIGGGLMPGPLLRLPEVAAIRLTAILHPSYFGPPPHHGSLPGETLATRGGHSAR